MFYVKDHFSESYTLKDLIKSSPESLELVEQTARVWIDSIPRQRNKEVLLPSSVLPKLSDSNQSKCDCCNSWYKLAYFDCGSPF